MLFNTVYKPLMADAFFNELTSAFTDTRSSGTAPGLAVAVEIAEFDDKFTLEFDLPGMAKSDLTIDLNDSVLVVSGERKSAYDPSATTEAHAGARDEAREESQEAKSPVVKSSRRYGHFQKSFKLPDTVNKENIAAQMNAGVLTLTLPKQAKKETRIAIDG